MTYEMGCEFIPDGIGIGVLKVDNNELLVLVCGQQKWRLV